MPINAFGGDIGSGKTYGVIEHVILPAIAKGRFVITNIDGLQYDKIYEYVVAEFYQGKIFCIGHIRHCDRLAPEDENFFPAAEAHDVPAPVPAPDAPFAQGGDLVVIDEATRYWVVGEKVNKRHTYFFREHRHFANECGHTCDLVVIDPDLTQLARVLKGKIEMTSLTHKPKEVGLDRYVVRMFRGVKFSGKPASVGGPYKFKPEIIALYRSYSASGAKEQAIDKRQSLLGALVFKLGGMVLLLILCIGAAIYLVRSKMDNIEKSGAPAAATASPAASPGSPVALQHGSSGYVPPAVSVPSGVSESLRVAGEVTIRGERWILLSDGARVRFESPGAFTGRGSLMVGQVQGERVTTWSGSSSQVLPAPETPFKVK